MDIRDCYRIVIASPEGKAVLADILSNLGFFGNVASSMTPECMAVGNTILSRLGVISSDGVDRYMQGLEYASSLPSETAGGDKEDDTWIEA